MTGMQAWLRRPRTLRRQLVLGVCAVVTAILLIVGTVTVLTLRAAVNDMVTTQLSRSVEAFDKTITKARATNGQIGSSAPTTPLKPLSQFVGQAPGNLIVLVRNGQVVDSSLFADGESTVAPPDVLGSIMNLPLSSGPSVDVPLAGIGGYRVQSRPVEGGEVLVSGVSLKRADHIVARETVIVAALTFLGLIIAAAATIILVRVALRPLGRVAATAAEVATLPLGRDHHAIGVRVPDIDTDPRTEVGLVGDTLNRLLVHVEGALTERAATDRRMRQFLTDASHELRTPLAAIQGYAELTRQDSSVLPKTTEYSLARIEAEANRMNALVSDLLLLAHLDEGQDLEATEVDLTDIVDTAVNDASVSAPGHRWRKELPDNAIWVRGDHARLYQVVANLLSNVRVHTPAGTAVTTLLTVLQSELGAVAELAVTDDGPGIDPWLLPHLFERFVRADKSRSRDSGNAGLGLSIVASIIDAHGGKTHAESGGGLTVFRVTLPIAEIPVGVSVDSTGPV